MPPAGLTDAAANEYSEKAEKLQKLFQEHGFMKKDRSMTAFEKFMRKRIRRSSAVTPITNISDMSRISDNVFEFLKTDEGLQKISLSVDQEYLGRLKNQTEPIDLRIGGDNLMNDQSSAGKIYYDAKRKNYVFSNFESRGVSGVGGFQELDTETVQRAFKFALDQARSKTSELINVGDSRQMSINLSAEALANIGITEIEATELDQALKARSLLSSIGTKALATDDAIKLSEALGTTSEFYGTRSSGDAIGTFKPAIVGEKTAEYSEALIKRGLPYATYDVRSRIMATAEASATSEIGKKLFIKVGQDGAANAADAAFYSTLAGVKNLQNLSDIGLQYTMGQGKENVFGLKRKVKNIDKEFDIAENSYFRTPVSAPTVKQANRVIMTADDLNKLVIREFNENVESKEIISEIKFGSKEFIENENLNRFIDSTVQSLDEELSESTINRAFAPKNLSVKSVDDLAEQIFSLNVRAYKNLKGHRATPIVAEMEALADKIFNTATSGDRKLSMQRLLEITAEGMTEEARLTKLQEYAAKESDKQIFVNNYKDSIKTISKSIEENNITGMKITGDSSVAAINESRLSQGISGVRDTDVALKSRVHRLVKVVETSKQSVIGFIMSGSVTDDMDAAARNLSGALSSPGSSVGVSRALDDQAAIDALISSAKLSEDINITPAGLDAGEQFADKAIKVGRELYKANKGKVALGALALAGVFTGYKMAKRADENDLYDATMNLAPAEKGQKPYGIQEALMGNGQTSRRKDPLFTAGVVGNLDRQKIGHTSMGPSKHSHLYGNS